jgi:hypothetical protein
MAGEEKSGRGAPSEKRSRDARLAAELRANLKRRKAAARVRDTAGKSDAHRTSGEG